MVDILNDLIDPILIIDEEYNIIDANKAFLDFFKKKDVIGKKCYELVPESDKPIKNCIFCKTRKTKKTESFEWYHPRLKKHLWISANPILENGSVKGIIHHFKDITEQKKADEAIKSINKSYERLTDNADEAIFRVEAKGSHVIYANPAAERIFGYSKEEWFSDPDLGFKIIHPDYAEKQKQIIKELNTKKKPIKNTVLGWIAKDGREVIMEYNIIPIKDKKGKIIYFESIGRDITERKKAEEALKESEEKYRTLFDSSRDAIMTLNPPSWLFNSGNQSTIKMFGCRDEKDFISYAPYELSPELQPDGKSSKTKALEMINKAMNKGSNFFEWTHKRVDGEEFPATVLLTKVKIRKGKPFLQATVRDITKQKKTEAEKERLQKRLANYAKKLEIKVKKLEKDRIKLTEKEKLVLWGITRYPYDNDKTLAKKLRIKRSTLTAIKNRLKGKEMYKVVNIPNIKELGAELITVSYGKYSIPYEKRKQLLEEKTLTDIDVNCMVSTDNEFIGGFISKNMVEFEKNINPILNTADKYNLLKNYKTIHFLLELNRIYKHFNYEDLLKHIFDIKIKEKPKEKREIVNKKLNQNTKKVLLALIEYPEHSIYDLSFKVNLTRTTIAKIKKELIEQGMVAKRIIPNASKLGMGLLLLTHMKQDSDFPTRTINQVLEKNPHLVFLIGGSREAIGISFFKDYDSYKEFKKTIHPYNGDLQIEEPTMLKIPAKNIKSGRIDLLNITKKLLEF